MAREKLPGSASALTVTAAAVCFSEVLFQVEDPLGYSLSPNSIFSLMKGCCSLSNISSVFIEMLI